MILELVNNSSVNYYNIGGGDIVPYIWYNVSNVSDYLAHNPQLFIMRWQDAQIYVACVFVLGMALGYGYEHYGAKIGNWLLGLVRK